MRGTRLYGAVCDRRSCNAAYILWVVALSLTVLLLLAVSQLVLPTAAPPQVTTCPLRCCILPVL